MCFIYIIIILYICYTQTYTHIIILLTRNNKWPMHTNITALIESSLNKWPLLDFPFFTYEFPFTLLMKTLLHTVSSFNFCCCSKIPWQKAASGINGFISSYNSVIVSRSSQELQTVISHFLSIVGKNPYILECLLVLSLILHSHTVQDSLLRNWCFLHLAVYSHINN